MLVGWRLTRNVLPAKLFYQDFYPPRRNKKPILLQCLFMYSSCIDKNRCTTLVTYARTDGTDFTQQRPVCWGIAIDHLKLHNTSLYHSMKKLMPSSHKCMTFHTVLTPSANVLTVSVSASCTVQYTDNAKTKKSKLATHIAKQYIGKWP